MMTNDRRRGVGKAGIDQREESTAPSWPSVRCTALRQDDLGKIAVMLSDLKAVRFSKRGNNVCAIMAMPRRK